MIALLRGWLPVAVLLACHATLGLTAIGRKSMTFDEGLHLGGGYSYWARNDYRLHPENGNWSQRFATLPLWLQGCEFPPPTGRAWQEGDPWATSDSFLFESGDDADTLLAQGRLMMIVPAVVLGLLVYLWSRRLFGPWGGLISLALYAFSPTMLANGFVTTSDLFVALFFSAAVWALWALLHNVSLATLALSCLALAAALLAKFSGLLVVPMGAILLAIRLSDLHPLRVSLGRTREVAGLWSQLGVFSLVAFAQAACVAAIIWGSYGFRYSAFAPTAVDGSRFLLPWRDLEAGLPPWTSSLLQFARQRHLLPEAYLYGAAYTTFTTAIRNSFLNGRFSQVGFAGFFPYCMVVKTPLALFLILGVAGWAIWHFRDRPHAQGTSVDDSSARNQACMT